MLFLLVHFLLPEIETLCPNCINSRSSPRRSKDVNNAEYIKVTLKMFDHIEKSNLTFCMYVQVLKLPLIIGAACNLVLCSRPRFCLEYFRNKIDPALYCVRNN